MEDNQFGEDLLKNKSYFVVNSARTGPMLQKRMEWDDFVVSCCCNNLGRFKLTTYFEKDHYVPGETAYCMVEAENHTKARCNSIDGIFMQEIAIGNDEGGHRNTSSLSTVKMRGLNQFETLIGENSQNFEIVLKGTEIQGGKNAGTHNTSTSGKLIQCNYFLNIEAKMNACICCTGSPHTKILVN